MIQPYTIRFATLHDVDQIMSFIHTHWQNNHILAREKSFFQYEFQNDQAINFVIAENKINEIIAILGFINYTKQYQESDIALVMWKALQGIDPFLGVKLLEFIGASGFRSVSSVGINSKTAPIYQYLGYQTGVLSHYYQLNPMLHEFNIATIQQKYTKLDKTTTQYDIIKLNSVEAGQFLDKFTARKYSHLPYKDKWYLNKRYLNHPVYHYHFYAIIVNHLALSIIIAREVVVEKSIILRIVDFLGDTQHIRGIHHALNQLLLNKEYEYIDCYQFGIAHELMHEAGFILHTHHDLNIIPNYFEPFIKKNISLHYCTNSKEKMYFFKGDGDQDRPNYFREK